MVNYYILFDFYNDIRNILCNFAPAKIKYNMNIKKVFARYGLTSKEVAERMGIKANNLSMTINGNPTYSTLCDIAKAVGCTPSELISDDEESQTAIITCPKCKTKFTIKVDSENE